MAWVKLDGSDVIEYYTNHQPDRADLVEKADDDAAVVAYFNRQPWEVEGVEEYVYKRVNGWEETSGYADIGDQLDMQYWDEVNTTTTWKDHIAAVKTAFPKP